MLEGVRVAESQADTMNHGATLARRSRRTLAGVMSMLVIGALVVLGLSTPLGGQDGLCGGEVPTIQWGPNAVATGGPDVIIGTDGADEIRGLGGDDIICTLGGADLVFAGIGNDRVFGGPGDDDLRGQGGNDTLNGEDGVDQLYGGSGNDTLDAGPGGNLGAPQVVRGQGNNDVLLGGDGDDDLEGGTGLDELHGGPGNDRLRGGSGADVLWGDEGDDHLEGNAHRDILHGGSGFDDLFGGTGNDDLFGESEDDSLAGEGGIDLCDGGTAGAVIGDSATATCETVLNVPFGDAQDPAVTCRGLAATIVGTAGADTLVGTNGPDVIWAGDGIDDVTGLGGDDVICGGAGADRLDGGDGNDVLIGDAGNDMLIGGAGHDDLSGRGDDDFLDGGDGTDRLAGDSGADQLRGGSGPDTLLGGPGVDVIVGEQGDDMVSGGPNDDHLEGGPGDDSIDGEAGADVIEGNSGDDLLTGGDQDDEITGGAGDDTILGGRGNDSLEGDDDNDILNGGAGVDDLRGGDGDDYLREGSDCRGDSGQNIIEACDSASDGQTADAPQVILFAMLDDADYHDFGYNSADAITPNIDRVAGEGISLNSYYAGSGICSPTRLSLMTGENPLAYGLTRLWPDTGALPTASQLSLGRKGLDASVTSLLDLELAGYETAHFGKWHLGDSWAQHGPGPVGFDVYRKAGVTPVDDDGNFVFVEDISDSQWNATDMNWLVGTENGDVLVTDEWRTDYLVDEIIDYIDSLGPGDRAFINWWSLVPHTPIRTPPNFDNSATNFDLTTQRGQLLAMMYEWDEGFGRVLDHLEVSGLADDSLVMVTSDNGGLRTALSPERLLTGAKSTLSEGGIRVPFAARWPGVIPEGAISSHTVVSSDILTTLRSMVGLPQRETYGLDIAPILRGAPEETRAGGVLWQMTTTSRAIAGAPAKDQDEWAYRDGCFKVLKRAGQSEVELFNVCLDPSESLDLSDELAIVSAGLVASAEAQRRDLSRIDVIPNRIEGEELIPFDERFNIADQDLTLEFSVSTVGPTTPGPADLLLSDALEVSASADDGTLTVRMFGIETAAASVTANLSSREVIVPIDTSGSQVRISVQGFLSDFSSLTIFVDDVEVGSLEGEASLFALASGRSSLRIGADGYVLDDIAAHTIVL